MRVNFLVFRGSLDPDKRLGVALLASVLLHALMLLSLSRFAAPGNIVARPAHAPLSVRLEKVVPESAEATPIVIENKKALLHQKLVASEAVATATPADIGPSLSQPGVSVSDVLFLRPISGRVSSPLLASGEYRRTSDIGEQPEMVAIRVPKYPRLASEQKFSGWVIVILFVDEEGKVVEAAAVESSESFNEFERDIAEELRGSTFKPGKLDGRAVKTRIFAMVRFDSKALSGLETVRGATSPASVEREIKR